jgi:hypothetical protein
MIDILDVIISPYLNKRFRIYLIIDGKMGYWDFGAKEGSTYIDHQDPVKRENYLKRHLANPTERYNIENYIPSAALFSAKLLWGDSTDFTTNLIQLQKDFNTRYK